MPLMRKRGLRAWNIFSSPYSSPPSPHASEAQETSPGDRTLPLKSLTSAPFFLKSTVEVGWGCSEITVAAVRWLRTQKALLFIPGTVTKGFQKYRAEIFYYPACLQPVIMRSRCLMCANALAAFAGENPSCGRGRGKSGDNYVVQSQTLFRSYCKRPPPPL